MIIIKLKIVSSETTKILGFKIRVKKELNGQKWGITIRLPN